MATAAKYFDEDETMVANKIHISRKIIHILHHAPPKNFSFWEGVLEGWHSKMSRALKKVNRDLWLECWQPTTNLVEKKSFEKDGIMYRLFYSAEPQFNSTISTGLLRALWKECRKDENVIIHLHGDRAILSYAILELFAKKGHCVFLQHHGSNGKSIVSPLDNRLIKYSRRFYACCKQKIRYLETLGVEEEKMTVRTMGVDFQQFKPMDKKGAKLQLGINVDAFCVLYVADFASTRGLVPICEAFKKLEREDDMCLLLVGGSPRDPLYKYAANLRGRYGKDKVYVRFRMPNSEMPLIYNAADVMCWYSKSKALWGGIGVSVMESLACDTPVVSNTLIHYPDVKEINFVGAIPSSETELKQCIERVMMRRAEMRCRESSIKHYDWTIIASETISDYETYGGFRTD